MGTWPTTRQAPTHTPGGGGCLPAQALQGTPRPRGWRSQPGLRFRGHRGPTDFLFKCQSGSSQRVGEPWWVGVWLICDEVGEKRLFAGCWSAPSCCWLNSLPISPRAVFRLTQSMLCRPLFERSSQGLSTAALWPQGWPMGSDGVEIEKSKQPIFLDIRANGWWCQDARKHFFS